MENKKKVMTVDDSFSIRQSIRLFLQLSGYEVIEAENGEDALEKLQKETVDLVITDINMPKLNGIELIKKLREQISHYRFIPIIVITTESVKGKGDEAKSAGATAWITKPFSQDTLTKLVDKLLK